VLDSLNEEQKAQLIQEYERAVEQEDAAAQNEQ
jgi:hypothetical protein